MRNPIQNITVMLMALVGIGSAGAQEAPGTPHILPGPARTLLFVQGIAGNGDGFSSFLHAGERIDVFRADGAGSRFKQVGSVSFPSSAAEMEKKLGDALFAAVLNQLKVRDADAAYQLLRHSPPDTLGVALLSPEVLEAFGMAFSDRSRTSTVPSRYRVDHVDAAGATIRTVTVDVDSQLPTYAQRFAVRHFLVSDSVASVSWSSTGPIADGFPVFADVYRRVDQSGTFEQVQRLFVTNSETSDSCYVTFSEPVPPGTHLAYYIQLEDLAGNKGPASDTLHALAFDVSQLSGIANLQVTDTTGGLLLTWDPLPQQALYSAIQLLKSRELGADYVVVDTIPAAETAYLDRAVIPSSSYYYKVRPLRYHLPGSEPLPFAEAHGHKSQPVGGAPPAPPRDVRAELTPQGVKVSWQHGDELNLFGYYVLRGSAEGHLEVISQPVQDTVFIDSLFSPGYSGQLHYAVQVADLSQQVSDTSAIASVAIIQPAVLAAPGGIQARRTVDGVALQWENTLLRDDQVTGFAVYRRAVGADSFELLNTTVLRLPFFTDSTALAGEGYDYAVTSADSWGNQSILSPTTSVAADRSGTLSPPPVLYLRNLTAGIEIGWPPPYAGQSGPYVVYRKQPGQTAFTAIGKAAPATVFVDTQVAPGVLYAYAVAVQEGDAEGDKSLPQSIRRQ